MGRREKERPSKNLHQVKWGFISQKLFGRDDIIRNQLIKIYRNTDTNIDAITDIDTGVIYDTDNQ